MFEGGKSCMYGVNSLQVQDTLSTNSIANLLNSYNLNGGANDGANKVLPVFSSENLTIDSANLIYFTITPPPQITHYLNKPQYFEYNDYTQYNLTPITTPTPTNLSTTQTSNSIQLQYVPECIYVYVRMGNAVQARKNLLESSEIGRAHV